MTQDQDHLAAAPEQREELPEPVAKIHSDGYWTEGKSFKEPLNFASMELYTANQLRAAIAAERERNPWRIPGGESRLRRKLEKRDQRIAGMKRRIEALEHALATRTMDLESLSRNVERAVTHALCNVRMIPVHGFGSNSKIVEVKLTDAPRRSSATSPEADGQMKKD